MFSSVNQLPHMNCVVSFQLLWFQISKSKGLIFMTSVSTFHVHRFNVSGQKEDISKEKWADLLRESHKPLAFHIPYCGWTTKVGNQRHSWNLSQTYKPLANCYVIYLESMSHDLNNNLLPLWMQKGKILLRVEIVEFQEKRPTHKMNINNNNSF